MTEGRTEVRTAGRTKGRNEGRTEGRMEGRTEGRHEGRTEGRKGGPAELFLVILRELRPKLLERRRDEGCVLLRRREGPETGRVELDAQPGHLRRGVVGPLLDTPFAHAGECIHGPYAGHVAAVAERAHEAVCGRVSPLSEVAVEHDIGHVVQQQTFHFGAKIHVAKGAKALEHDALEVGDDFGSGHQALGEVQEVALLKNDRDVQPLHNLPVGSMKSVGTFQ